MSHPELLEQEYLDELALIVNEMLDGLCEANAQQSPEAAAAVAASVGDSLIEANVAVLGDSELGFTVRVSGPDAVGTTAVLTGQDPATVTLEEATATVSELTNLLGGSAKTLVDAETSLGIPATTVLDAQSAPPLENSVFVQHPLGLFQVRLADR